MKNGCLIFARVTHDRKALLFNLLGQFLGDQLLHVVVFGEFRVRRVQVEPRACANANCQSRDLSGPMLARTGAKVPVGVLAFDCKEGR